MRTGTNKEKLLRFLYEHKQNRYCDDCLSVLVGVSPRQQVNQICGRDPQSFCTEQAKCCNCGKIKLTRYFGSKRPVMLVQRDENPPHKQTEESPAPAKSVSQRTSNSFLYETLKTFMDRVGTGQIEIYNEFSFQHELGIFLREKCAKDYKVQFERNTSFFGISSLVKKEIDLVVFNENEKYAIELKHPLNGQYPEQMFSFVKDIRFMEQLAEAGFTATYCLTLVKDKSFYSGPAQDGIYSYFRGQKPIHGKIHKPTGEQKEEIFIDIHGNYIIRWLPCGDMKYFLVEISA